MILIGSVHQKDLPPRDNNNNNNHNYPSTVEPLIKDPPRRGHIETTSLQRTHFKVPNVHFLIFLIHFEPLKSGQPLYKGQNG